MGKDGKQDTREKLMSEMQDKVFKTIGDYTLSVDELPFDGQLISAIKATHKNGTSVSVSIDPSSESSLESFRVLTSDSGEFIFKIDQSGNLSLESKAHPLLSDDVLCAAVQKLVTEKK